MQLRVYICCVGLFYIQYYRQQKRIYWYGNAKMWRGEMKTRN